MKRLKWFWNRLKLMSLREVLTYRLPQQFQLRILGRIQARKQFKQLQHRHSFESAIYNSDRIHAYLPVKDLIFTIPIFDQKINLDLVENWRWDPKNNISSPIRYYGKLNRQDFDMYGDVKYVSELSRFFFLPYLALDHYRQQEPDSLKRISDIVSDWDSQNPYLYSVNWTSGIEIAIRAVNLVFSYLILRQSQPKDSNLLVTLEVLLSKHYHFLKRHPSKYSSANNHLTAELMGLLLLSCVFQVDNKEKDKWVLEFYRQVETQINPDGIHMELSTRYHAEVLEHFIISLVALRSTNFSVPKQVVDRISGMGAFLEHSIKEGLTNFGDDDQGSAIHPYFEKDFSYYSSLLKSLNHLTGSKYGTVGGLDARNYLIFGESFSDQEYAWVVRDTLFKDSGYCFLYDAERHLKIAFDTGTIGDSISAAHGHSDLQHFSLFLKGEPIIVDTGTYQYHEKNLFWRNYFRGIAAHNCISVNHRHHAVMNNRMSWLQRPETTLEVFQVNSVGTRCRSSHLAYADIGVSVGRELYLNRTEGLVEIIDSITFEQPDSCVISAYLHFHPNITIEKSGEICWTIMGPGVRLEMESELFANAQLVKGNTELPLGWYSSGFGQKQKSTTLHVEFLLAGDASFRTIIHYT